ncbi:MAG TPA: hypothetical protein VGB13_13475 [Candidatus Krumholzibacteria bacterium]
MKKKKMTSRRRKTKRRAASEPSVLSPGEKLDRALTLAERAVGLGTPLSVEELAVVSGPVKFDGPQPFEPSEELRAELEKLEAELGIPGFAAEFWALGEHMPYGGPLLPVEQLEGFIERYPQLAAMLRYEVEDDGTGYYGRGDSRDSWPRVPGSRYDQDMTLVDKLDGWPGNQLRRELPTVAGMLAAYFEPGHPTVDLGSEHLMAGGILGDGAVGFAHYDLGDDGAMTRIFALAAAFAAKDRAEFERMVKVARSEFFSQKSGKQKTTKKKARR